MELICIYYAILHKGHEHPQVLDSKAGSGTNPLRILSDNSMCNYVR